MLPTPIPVLTQDGVRGVIEPNAWISGAEQSEILVRFEDGSEQVIPTTALEARMSGGYWLMMTREELRRRGVDTQGAGGIPGQNMTDELVIPVIEEEADVRVERVATGKVRITKEVHTREEEVSGPLYDERVTVERRLVNREVEAPPPVRHEGETMVIPVVEEIIVKRYVLKEEILVTKERTARQEPQTFTLRREEVTVERLEGDVTPDSNNRQQGETQ